MEEIIKSIKAFLYDRASSPLIGALIISWSFWNYKMFFILFSDEKIENKFLLISTLFDKNNPIEIFGLTLPFSLSMLCNGAIYPILLTIFYIYIYPFLAEPVYKLSLQTQLKLINLKKENEGKKLLTVEESNKMQLELLNLQDKYEEETEKLRTKISSLQALLNTQDISNEKTPALESYKKLANEKNTSDESTDEKLNEAETEILKLYMNKGDLQLEKKQILSQVKKYSDIVEVALSSLVQNKYIREEYIMPSMVYSITQKGKKYLIENFPDEYK